MRSGNGDAFAMGCRPCRELCHGLFFRSELVEPAARLVTLRVGAPQHSVLTEDPEYVPERFVTHNPGRRNLEVVSGPREGPASLRIRTPEIGSHGARRCTPSRSPPSPPSPRPRH